MIIIFCTRVESHSWLETGPAYDCAAPRAVCHALTLLNRVNRVQAVSKILAAICSNKNHFVSLSEAISFFAINPKNLQATHSWKFVTLPNMFGLTTVI